MENPQSSSTTVSGVARQDGPRTLIGVGHFRARPKSLPVLLRELCGEFDGVINKTQEQCEVLALSIGHIVNVHGNRLAHYRAQE